MSMGVGVGQVDQVDAAYMLCRSLHTLGVEYVWMGGEGSGVFECFDEVRE